MFKRAKLNDVLNDYIVFRELNPIKDTLPKFLDIKDALGLKELPRKSSFEFARALKFIIDSIAPFTQIYYIGDNEASDGAVISNLSKISGAQIFGIIVDPQKTSESFSKPITILSSWQSLYKNLKDASFDNVTLVLIDIDKTFLGAKGRNDLAIDKARTKAIFKTLLLVHKEADYEEFFKVYKSIYKKDFLSFTQDNQDIIALTSIVIYEGAYTFEDFVDGFMEKRFETPKEFVNLVLEKGVKNRKLEELLRKILLRLESGLQTPFEEFRKEEFKETIALMDYLPDETSPSTLYASEILITKEVFEIGELALKGKATIFGISDKPELASLPKEPSLTDFPPIFEKLAKVG